MSEREIWDPKLKKWVITPEGEPVTLVSDIVAEEFEAHRKKRRQMTIKLVLGIIGFGIGMFLIGPQIVGEGAGPADRPSRSPAVATPSPTPSLEREEAVAQRIIDFMATHHDTDANLRQVEIILASFQCERVRSGGTLAGTKRAAVGIASQAPEGMVGVYARMQWGPAKGMFLVAHFDLDCAPEYVVGG